MSDIYDDRFQGCVQRLEYDFTTRTGLGELHISAALVPPEPARPSRTVSLFRARRRSPTLCCADFPAGDVLHLLAVAALVVAIPQLAQAMGPISAALKNQGVRTAAADPPAVTTPS